MRLLRSFAPILVILNSSPAAAPPAVAGRFGAAPPVPNPGPRPPDGGLPFVDSRLSV